MKKFTILLLVLVLLAPVALFANGSSESADKGPVELYIYNSKGENAKEFEEMCKAYTAETGVPVKSFSIGSGQDHMETLRNEMNSQDMPTIFSIQGNKELIEWRQGGFAEDLNKVTAPADFVKLIKNISPGLRLTVTGSESYGIPYNVEGYGYIVDTAMVSEIFGSKDIITDIQMASYDEWADLIVKLAAWIKAPTAFEVKVNGKSYKASATKGDLTSKLNGVFAVMGSQKWTYGDHFVNVALNAAFSNPNAALAATKAEVEALQPLFTAYAEALDLKTSNLAGANGPETRGQDFVSSAKYGYDQTVQIFADSKAIFLKQGNWAYGNINKANPEKAKRLVFLPVKMPFTQAMVTVEGQTPAKLNSSIPVFVPNYYAVNALASEAQKEAAYNFLVWLNTSETGKNYIVNKFNFIPYNADPKTTVVPNSLGNSIISYINEGRTINAPYQGAPASWSGDVLGLKMMESYMTKAQWTKNDYQDIANYAVQSWINLIQ